MNVYYTFTSTAKVHHITIAIPDRRIMLFGWQAKLIVFLRPRISNRRLYALAVRLQRFDHWNRNRIYRKHGLPLLPPL